MWELSSCRAGRLQDLATCLGGHAGLQRAAEVHDRKPLAREKETSAWASAWEQLGAERLDRPRACVVFWATS